MQRTLGTVLVAVLVVLAGCSGVLGGSGDDEPVETIAPAPVPTDEPMPTPVPQLAPGLTGEGIENASAFTAAHTSFLHNRSYTIRSNFTVLAPNGSVVTSGTSIIRVGPPGEGFHIVPERNGSNEQYSEIDPVYTEWWSNGERVFVKQRYANGTTRYDRLRTDVERFRHDLTRGSAFFLEPFGAANTTVTERFTRNGTTLYLVRGYTQSEQMFRQENLSIRLLVDSRGVIHEYRTVRQVPSMENISKIIREGRFSRIGATDAPERPSWVDEAMNRTTPMAEETETTTEE